MKKTIILLVILALAVGALVYVIHSKNARKNIVQKGDAVITAIGDTGKAGSAALNHADQKTDAKVSLIDTQAMDLPVSINSGTCAAIGDVKYSLETIQNGASQSMIDVPTQQLMSEFPLVVVISKSEQEKNVYIGCGEITK